MLNTKYSLFCLLQELVQHACNYILCTNLLTFTFKTIKYCLTFKPINDWDFHCVIFSASCIYSWHMYPSCIFAYSWGIELFMLNFYIWYFTTYFRCPTASVGILICYFPSLNLILRAFHFSWRQTCRLFQVPHAYTHIYISSWKHDCIQQVTWPGWFCFDCLNMSVIHAWHILAL